MLLFGCSDAENEAVDSSREEQPFQVNEAVDTPIADNAQVREPDPRDVPDEDLKLLGQLFRDKQFPDFYAKFVDLKRDFPQDVTLVTLERLMHDMTQRAHKNLAPLRLPELDYAQRLEWQLIENDYAATSGLAPIEAARSSVLILARVNWLLERVPNFWEGRVLQAHLALGLGENASGRAAVSWMHQWNSIGQYDAATVEAFRRRGWLQESQTKKETPEQADVVDYAAQLGELLKQDSEMPVDTP